MCGSRWSFSLCSLLAIPAGACTVRAGAMVAGLLAEIAGQGYFVLRRFVTGVFGALGTVGGSVTPW